MDDLKFLCEEHKTKYEELLDRVKKNGYVVFGEERAVMYLIALMETEKKGITDRLFDFEKKVIREGVLKASWQSSATLAATKLALNLWCGAPTNPKEKWTVYDLFGDYFWDKYYLEAIRIRFWDSCNFNEKNLIAMKKAKAK